MYTFAKFLKLNILCFIDSEVVTLLLLLSLKSVRTVIQDGLGWSGVTQIKLVKTGHLNNVGDVQVSMFALDTTVAIVMVGCGVESLNNLARLPLGVAWPGEVDTPPPAPPSAQLAAH